MVSRSGDKWLGDTGTLVWPHPITYFFESCHRQCLSGVMPGWAHPYSPHTRSAVVKVCQPALQRRNQDLSRKPPPRGCWDHKQMLLAGTHSCELCATGDRPELAGERLKSLPLGLQVQLGKYTEPTAAVLQQVASLEKRQPGALGWGGGAATSADVSGGKCREHSCPSAHRVLLTAPFSLGTMEPQHLT